MIETKSLWTSLPSKDKDLFIFQQLKTELRPPKICEKFQINKKTIQNHLSLLKRAKLIKKVGYGVWEVLENIDEKEVLNSIRIAKVTPSKNKTSYCSTQDLVRGHGFQFTLQLPKNLKNWDKREELLLKMGYKLKKLSTFGGGQAIEFQGKKIYLTNKSIIIYEKESFISETAKDSQSQAIDHFLKFVNQLEKALHSSFGFGNRYRFKVSRQHYALIQNALARQYNESGEKLNVYNDKGLWFVIDNSYHLNEAETVHPKTAVEDNKKVQDFFNGIKSIEGYTPQFVINSLERLTENWNEYGIHIKSHIRAIQSLGEGINKQNEIFMEIKELLNNLKR
jgi:hypothetical protein